MAKKLGRKPLGVQKKHQRMGVVVSQKKRGRANQQQLLNACREILAELRSPRLHKFVGSLAPNRRSIRDRDTAGKASLEKLAKDLKALRARGEILHWKL